MNNYTLTHLSNAELLRDLTALVTRDRATTAMLLAHIAEVDARELYRPAGYSSMFVYCVDELHMSEGSVYKLIRAARAARRFPVLYSALAEGLLHLAAASLLASHLTLENADELIEAATHRRKSEIEELLARRFGARELPVTSRCVPATTCERAELSPGTIATEILAPENPIRGLPQSESIGPINLLDETPGHPGEAKTNPDDSRSDVAPPSHEHFRLHFTIPKSSHEKLKYAQTLLSHSVPSGDVSQVFDRALDALISELEKRKFAATRRPRQKRNPPENSSEDSRRHVPAGRRHVPAPVRRAVWKRDEGQCTFVGARGVRCDERHFLEFDHVEPVARGGKATVEGIRLRCRAHNQYEAGRVFGASFMRRKRHEARMAGAETQMAGGQTRATASGAGP